MNKRRGTSTAYIYYMHKKYDLDDSAECLELNRLLNRYGVHIEHDLFDHPYILIDMKTLCSLSNIGGRPKKLSDEQRRKAIQLKSQGNTVRQISSKLGISIGSVSAITRNHRNY